MSYHKLDKLLVKEQSKRKTVYQITFQDINVTALKTGDLLLWAGACYMDWILPSSTLCRTTHKNDFDLMLCIHSHMTHPLKFQNNAWLAVLAMGKECFLRESDGYSLWPPWVQGAQCWPHDHCHCWLRYSCCYGPGYGCAARAPCRGCWPSCPRLLAPPPPPLAPPTLHHAALGHHPQAGPLMSGLACHLGTATYTGNTDIYCKFTSLLFYLCIFSLHFSTELIEQYSKAQRLSQQKWETFLFFSMV